MKGAGRATWVAGGCTLGGFTLCVFTLCAVAACTTGPLPTSAPDPPAPPAVELTGTGEPRSSRVDSPGHTATPAALAPDRSAEPLSSTVESAVAPTIVSPDGVDPRAACSQGDIIGQRAEAGEGGSQDYAIDGPLHIDSISGLIFAVGRWDRAPSAAGTSRPASQTLVLDARDGCLVDVLPHSPRVAVDSERFRVILDLPDTGLSIYDTRSREHLADFALPTAEPNSEEGPWGSAQVDPIVDPRDGTIYVTRGARLLVVNPDSGAIVRSFDDWFPGSRNTIRRAVFDPSSRTLYLAALDLVTPAYVHAFSIVGRNVDDGRVVLEDTAFDHLDALVAWDGHLLVMFAAGRENGFTMGLWRDGQMVHGIDSLETWRHDVRSTVVRDASRRRFLMPVMRDEAGNTVLAAMNEDDISIEALFTAPSSDTLEAFDQVTERLYFVDASRRLDVMPMRAIAPPTPGPATTPAPQDDIRLKLIVPATPAMSRRFGHVRAELTVNNALVYAGGPLMFSESSGTRWEARQGGIPSTVELTDVTVSPNFVVDENAFAILPGLGIFRSTDGGRWWRPSSTGLDSMSVTALRISPSYPRDRTVYAETETYRTPRHLFRSRDSGDSWQAIADVHHVAFSPDIATDRKLYAFKYETAEVVRSDDGGDSWQALGRVPAAEDAVGGGLITIRDPEDGSTILLAHMFDTWPPMLSSHPTFGPRIWRSADGGQSWTRVLDVGEAVTSLTALSGPSEGIVLVGGRAERNASDDPDSYFSDFGDLGIFRSMDSGATWQWLVVPETLFTTFTPSPDGQVLFERKGGGHAILDIREMDGIDWEWEGEDEGE